MRKIEGSETGHGREVQTLKDRSLHPQPCPHPPNLQRQMEHTHTPEHFSASEVTTDLKENSLHVPECKAWTAQLAFG